MLIHRMRLDDHRVVLDINSGAVHIVDEMTYDILGVFDGENIEETKKYFNGKYDSDELSELLGELVELKEEGLLFTPEYPIPDTFKQEPIVKSLCLHVAHDCNLLCRYCFAGTGDFGGHRALMSFDTAKKAIEYAIKGSKQRKHLEIDLFGGEPLCNYDVVKQIILYVRKREEECGKTIKLTLTTNGTMLTEDKARFFTENRVMLVLSLDGSKETHDYMRPYPKNVGSYDVAVKNFKKFIEIAGNKNYYLRGTYTHHSVHFTKDVLAMTEVGSDVSMEPVIGIDEDYVLTKEDLPILKEEYDKLARVYLKRRHEGHPFNFFHFNVALNNGPCVNKRLAGCGAGHEYFAVTPEGDLYPCHQFVGREEYKMGTLDTGIVRPDLVKKFRNTHVMTKPKCKECWARFFCSGGCHANADLINHDISEPYEYGCELQKKRLENALIVQALLAEEVNEGKEDLRSSIDNFVFKVDEAKK